VTRKVKIKKKKKKKKKKKHPKIKPEKNNLVVSYQQMS